MRIEVITVSLSFPAIFLCSLVLVRWLPEALRALRQERDSADWLVFGVAISFFGVLSNLVWWTGYWIADVQGASVWTDWFLDWGSLANLFSRQGAIIIASWCHLKAYKEHDRRNTRHPNFHLALGFSMAAIVFTLLMTGIGVQP